MNYDLPVSLDINGTTYEIRSDYRAVLDICTALSDAELDTTDKALVALDIFYPAFADMPQSDYEEALKSCFEFINGGEPDDGQPASKVMDWNQDFPYIVAPINRVMGCDIRSIPYDRKNNKGGLHWWTVLAAYREIGDCLFAQIVAIRDKQRRGKRLEKHEREWYNRNRKLVDFKTKYTADEEDFLKSLVGK